MSKAGDTAPLNTRRTSFFPLYLRRPFILAFLVSRSSRSSLKRGAIDSPLIVIKSVQTITPLLLLLLFLLPPLSFPGKGVSTFSRTDFHYPPHLRHTTKCDYVYVLYPTVRLTHEAAAAERSTLVAECRVAEEISRVATQPSITSSSFICAVGKALQVKYGGTSIAELLGIIPYSNDPSIHCIGDESTGSYLNVVATIDFAGHFNRYWSLAELRLGQNRGPFG